MANPVTANAPSDTPDQRSEDPPAVSKLVGRSPHRDTRCPDRRIHEQQAGAGWPARFVEIYGRVILLAGWWSMFRLLTHHLYRLERVDDLFAFANLPAGPSLFSVAFLFLLGGAVRRRMRACWWLLLGVQVLSAVSLVETLIESSLLGSGVDPIRSSVVASMAVNAAATVLLTALLAGSRGAFGCRARDGAHRWALLVLGSGISISLATSITLTLAAPASLRGVSHQLQWAVRVVFGAAPDRSDLGWAGQAGHHWIDALAGLLSGVSVIVAAIVFLRSARAKEYLTAQDELEIRGLLTSAGERDSLGYFATRRDKSVIFSPNHDAAITHRVLANVSLVSADPVGPVGNWPAAIREWLSETRAHGWFPAVLAASEAGARAYRAAGLKALAMGDEAVIEVEHFSLTDRSLRPIRRAARRIRRAGYTTTVHRHRDLRTAQLAQIERCAQDWRADKTERGFSMALGRLGDRLDGRSVAVLAHDRDGQLRGLLSLVPWGQRGLSLDLMRRDRGSDNGLNEAMVVALVEQARNELGVHRISLNFAMFRGVFSAAERVDSRPLVRLTSHLMRYASRFWQIESLYLTNARYQPSWHTRYLCYDSRLTLARVAAAAAAAEGFLPSFGGARQVQHGGEEVDYAGVSMPLEQAVAAQQSALRRAGTELPCRNQQQRARIAKIELLRRAGRQAYPVSVPRDCEVAEVRARFTDLAPGTHTGQVVSVAGRVRALRDFGGLSFAVLTEDGASLQAMITTGTLGAAEQTLLRSCLDLGDLLAVTGEIVTSRHGELSVLVSSWQLAAKCLTPVPKLRPPTVSGGAATRQRQLQLITEPAATGLLTIRSQIVSAIRAALARRDYTEVETPMLTPVHGGANARPFATHMNAYDIGLYLRIAPELHLKRLCAAGMSKIFELNRNFRNEGVDDAHNPEFTSLELYRAFADYRDMQELTHTVICEVATAVFGAPIARRQAPGGRVIEVDLSAPWPSMSVHAAVSVACGATVTPDTSVGELGELCRANAIAVSTNATAATLVVDLYERLVEACTIEPTFYTDFPVESSPLTRAHRDDPRLAERWDLVAYGQEIGTAYSELTDPLDQRRRLTEQSLQRAAGDPEAMAIDEDFLTALGYAMPPTGGLGIGVDRLVMLLTGATIRQTLAFPFTRRGSDFDG